MKIIVIVSAFVTFEMSGIQHSAHRHLAPRSYSSLKGSKPEYLHTQRTRKCLCTSSTLFIEHI